MGSSPSCDRIYLRYHSISLYMKRQRVHSTNSFHSFFIEIYIIIMKQANEYIQPYSTGTGKYINIYIYIYIYIYTYSFLFLYNSRSRAPLIEKNFLSISGALTNKAERRIPGESPIFGLV